MSWLCKGAFFIITSVRSLMIFLKVVFAWPERDIAFLLQQREMGFVSSLEPDFRLKS